MTLSMEFWRYQGKCLYLIQWPYVSIYLRSSSFCFLMTHQRMVGEDVWICNNTYGFPIWGTFSGEKLKLNYPQLVLLLVFIQASMSVYITTIPDTMKWSRTLYISPNNSIVWMKYVLKLLPNIHSLIRLFIHSFKKISKNEL